MPTDPLTGSRYPASSAAPNVNADIQNAVIDLSDNTIPDFATTTARDNAWTAWVALGNTLRNGLHSVVNGVRYRRIGGNWRVDRDRNIGRTVINLGGGFSISSGGSAETGITGTIALSSPGASFTLYEAGTVSFHAAFRAGPGTGAAQCTLKINGTTVGNVAISRTDGTVPVLAIVALAAGTHSAALRVDAIAGSVLWVDGILTFTEGIAE